MPRLLWAVYALMTALTVSISSHYSHAGIAPLPAEPAFAVFGGVCLAEDEPAPSLPHID